MSQHLHPLLVKVQRGNHMESFHHVDAVILEDTGTNSLQEQTLKIYGNADRLLFPRSTLKWIQAMPLVDLFEKKQIKGPELALACASHRGEPEHLQILSEWQQRIQLSDSDLVCGFHLPGAEHEMERFFEEHKPKSKLFNNCAGKHLGFCHWSLVHGISTKNYWLEDHPAQNLFKKNCQRLLGELPSETFGIDGCGVPNFRFSLRQLGKMYLRWLESKEGLSLLKTIQSYPRLLSGTDGLDTWIGEKSKGLVVSKTGAEGMYIALLPSERKVIALKAQDGQARASKAALLAILRDLNFGGESFLRFVDVQLQTPLYNWAGDNTGQIFVEGVAPKDRE